MFSAEPESASLVESAMTTGRPLRRWLLAAIVTAVSVSPEARRASVAPVQGAMTSTSKSFSGPTRSASTMLRMTPLPVSASRRAMKSSAFPKRLSVQAAVSLMRAVRSQSAASFSASFRTFSYVQ